MNFIYLSPHYPPNFKAFCKNLNYLGVRVLGIADTPYEEIGEDLQNTLTEYYKVSNLEDYDQVYRAVAYFIHKYGRIDGVASMNEYWLETEARLRTDFNIEGIKINEIEAMRKKSLMKQKFIENGIPVARGKVVNNIAEAEELIKELGYPIVAKPNKGVGASNTYKIKNHEDLEDFFRTKTNEEYIAEEFIEGTICTYDGLVDGNGEVVFDISHIYQSVMDLVNYKKNVSIYSIGMIPDDLKEIGQKIIKTYNLKKMIFHFEFFRTEDGRLIALEVNMRAPGGSMIDMFNYAADVDMFREWANIIANRPFEEDRTLKYCCAFAGRRTKEKKYAYSNEEIFKKYGHILMFADRILGSFADGMGDYVYVARSKNIGLLREFIDFVQWEE